MQNVPEDKRKEFQHTMKGSIPESLSSCGLRKSIFSWPPFLLGNFGFCHMWQSSEDWIHGFLYKRTLNKPFFHFVAPGSYYYLCGVSQASKPDNGCRETHEKRRPDSKPFLLIFLHLDLGNRSWLEEHLDPYFIKEGSLIEKQEAGCSNKKNEVCLIYVISTIFHMPDTLPQASGTHFAWLLSFTPTPPETASSYHSHFSPTNVNVMKTKLSKWE